ncbi:MAG: hypothetical protein JWN04_5037 [Myxococcaceae bacterium]|nr:hypothetical protein [Myxococcaceae bacterium]
MTDSTLKVDDLFRERAVQMAAWGIPFSQVTRVRKRIEDLSSDGPGGWVYEWGQEAERAERTDPLLASALWGAAKFPTVWNESRRSALHRQLACYLAAAPHFPARFERRVIDGVPTHLFQSRARTSDAWVLLSGGLDTFKMELHRLALALVRVGLSVAAVDMPGTGESPGPLTPHADRQYLSVLDAVARGRRRGFFGVSFAGHWAAKLALLGEVDAAVDLGGPIGARPATGALIRELPNGMPQSLAHALGLTSLPDEQELTRVLADFSLRRQQLLDPERLQTPLLVCNGARDPYIPCEDTTEFYDYSHAEVVLLRDAYHCAGDRFSRVAPFLVSWLRATLSPSRASRAALWLTRAMLPPSGRRLS